MPKKNDVNISETKQNRITEPWLELSVEEVKGCLSFEAVRYMYRLITGKN